MMSLPGMNQKESRPSVLSLRVTKASARMGCLFFVFGIVLSPGPESSLGIVPWPVVCCIWGAMFVSALISILGYFTCKQEGERISAFYVVCPLVLFIALFIVWNLWEVVHALLRFEGAI